eukprot:PhM_4_TR5797/c0_g1_i1/m.67546/K10573/UBE2A, UBC2, RAD6A; ubiquitin-conjugating enzyme E2 A
MDNEISTNTSSVPTADEDVAQSDQQQAQAQAQASATTASSTTTAQKRLMRDFKTLRSDPPQGISGVPVNGNLMKWNAVIFGPDETCFEGGTFRLRLEFSEDYPHKPPKVQFVTKMFHPNIYADGSICLDILKNQWSPTYDVSAVLTSIQSLLTDPNPNSPANSEAALMFRDQRKLYERRVRELIEASWEEDEASEEEDW